MHGPPIDRTMTRSLDGFAVAVKANAVMGYANSHEAPKCPGLVGRLSRKPNKSNASYEWGPTGCAAWYRIGTTRPSAACYGTDGGGRPSKRSTGTSSQPPAS